MNIKVTAFTVSKKSSNTRAKEIQELDKVAEGNSKTNAILMNVPNLGCMTKSLATVSNRNAGRTVETPELRSYNAEFRSFSMDSPPFLVF